MWYEILPTATIIVTALAIPNVTAYFLNKFFLGQPYFRDVSSTSELFLFLRDKRVGEKDSAYVYRGLENIPDGDEKN